MVTVIPPFLYFSSYLFFFFFEKQTEWEFELKVRELLDLAWYAKHN